MVALRNNAGGYREKLLRFSRTAIGARFRSVYGPKHQHFKNFITTGTLELINWHILISPESEQINFEPAHPEHTAKQLFSVSQPVFPDYSPSPADH